MIVVCDTDPNGKSCNASDSEYETCVKPTHHRKSLPTCISCESSRHVSPTEKVYVQVGGTNKNHTTISPTFHNTIIVPKQFEVMHEVCVPLL